MFTTSAQEFLHHFPTLPASAPATARAAFLLAPSSFALAEQSAGDNQYMDLRNIPDATGALLQHAALAEALRADVPVITFPGDADNPDGVFPNNAFATAPGKLVIGRMRHPVRQRETTRTDIRAFFKAMGYAEADLSARNDMVAELTGALIIDRARGIGYAGLTERCDLAGARAMHEAFGLNMTFAFELASHEYHTNVVMALLASRALILAADGFADSAVAAAISTAYNEQTVWLTPAQKNSFAANAITLGDNRVWMSERGARALTAVQRNDLARWGFAIGSVELGEIEKAGGSLRCCVAEIY